MTESFSTPKKVLEKSNLRSKLAATLIYLQRCRQLMLLKPLGKW